MLLLDIDIRQRLLAARMPAMPQLLTKLIAQCQADETGTAELAELIATDSAITARILEVANSSAYHRKGSSATVHQALLTLGTDAVKMLLINESVFQLFDQFAREKAVDLSEFWEHSLLAALLAKLIAQRIGYAHVEEAYLAGLLHDIGRLALLATVPDEYGLDFQAVDDDILCASEQRTLQITHPEAGALLIERWELDSFIADSVLYHHEPPARLEAGHPLLRIVCVAHLLSADEPDRMALNAAELLCGLNEADATALRSQALLKLKKTAEEMGIDVGHAARRRAKFSAGDGTGQPATAAPAASSPRPVGADGAREKMAREMGGMMMASEMARFFGSTGTEARLHEAIVQAARILFDFDPAALLLADGDRKTLRGTASGRHGGRIGQFSAALSGAVALASCVQQRRVTTIDSDATALGVPEEQLLRMLDADCLVLIPVMAEWQCIGVLAGAIPQWRQAELTGRAAFLTTFGVQAGSALHKLREAAREADRQTEAVASQFRSASRQLAHEVNNPLAIIRNYLGVLDHRLSRDERVQSEVSILNEEIDRVGQIISGLANFRAPTPAAAGQASAGRVIEEVVRLVRDTGFAASGVTLTARGPDALPEIAIDGGALKQVLLNLVKNAVEAVDGKGDIEVGARGPVNRDGALYVELWVRDNGPGIAADILPSLFTTVHSTKAGTQRGLGLTIVYRLVKEAQGFIACRSDAAGTTFELLLPVASVTHRPAAP